MELELVVVVVLLLLLLLSLLLLLVLRLVPPRPTISKPPRPVLWLPSSHPPLRCRESVRGLPRPRRSGDPPHPPGGRAARSRGSGPAGLRRPWPRRRLSLVGPRLRLPRPRLAR